MWGPGQATPVHDHTVWDVVGVLRGVEQVERFRAMRARACAPTARRFYDAPATSTLLDQPRAIFTGSATGAGRGSVSIHVHGGDIGSISRSVYASDGTASRFVSNYKNAIMPNFRGDDTVANKVKFDRAAG